MRSTGGIVSMGITAVAVVVNLMSSSSGDRIFHRGGCGWLFDVHEPRLLLLLLLFLVLILVLLLMLLVLLVRET